MADEITLQGSTAVEQTTVWDTPGAPNIGRAPLPGVRGPIKADITRQYVAASPNNYLLNLIRILPFAIDDITASFGSDLYERMLFDSIVSSAVLTFKAAVLEDGVSFSPAVTDKKEQGYDEAVQYTRDAERMFEDCESDIDTFLFNMLDGLTDGNKVAEITYRIERMGGRQQYLLDRLAVKPRESTGFAVDSYRRVIGLMALLPGVGFPVYSGSMIVKPDETPNLLPREKFCVFTFRKRDEDPRGTSVLRAAYTPWQLKMNLWGQYQKWLVQFASPSLIGKTAQEAIEQPLVDPLGNPLIGTDGNPLMPLTPEEAMLNELTKFASGSAMVVPYGSEVNPIEMHGQGAPFLTAFRMLDEQMTMAISGQTMTSMQPSRGTQSQGSVQENTFETLVHQAKASVIRMMRRDLLRPWVRYNHGAAAMTLAPRVALGQTEQQDFTGELVALSGGGFTVDPSQFPAIDRRLGLPPRAENWQEQRQADEQKTAELAAKVKQATGIQVDTQQPTPKGPVGRPIMPKAAA